MTKEHKPLCPLRRCCDLGGPKARPVMPRTQSPHSVCGTPCLLLPPSPLTLICIPRMPTQSGSQPGTLGACKQRHALPLNKSSSVVPEHDECRMSSMHPVPLPGPAIVLERDRPHALYCAG
eukprot:superscaffoldBa00002259_g13699